MKKILLYIFAIIISIFSSCQEVIEEIRFENDQQMAVIAIINNQGIDNKIYCYYQDNGRLSVVNDAVINIYVDEKLVETITEFEGYQNPYIFGPDDVEFCKKKNLSQNMWTNHVEGYKVKSTFKPGDKVRMEVSSKIYQAKVWAQTIVPMPASAQMIDTILVRADFEDEGYMEDYYNVRLKIQSENPEKPGNYRINAGYMVEEKATIALVKEESLNKIADLKDTSDYRLNTSLEVKEDIALTDGKGFIQKEDEDSFISMDTYYFNHYRMIGSNYFKDGQYTVSFYTKTMYWYDTPFWYSYNLGNKGNWLDGKKFRYLYDFQDYLDELLAKEIDENLENENEEYKDAPRLIMYEKDHDEYIYYQIYSMPEVEYFYLKGRSNQEDIDWSDSDFVEPVVLKSNINNGLGIFAIETLTEGKIKIKNSLINFPDEVPGYYNK